MILYEVEKVTLSEKLTSPLDELGDGVEEEEETGDLDSLSCKDAREDVDGLRVFLKDCEASAV